MLSIYRTSKHLAALGAIYMCLFSGISLADVTTKWRTWPPDNTPKTPPEIISPEQLNKMQRANQLWDEMQTHYDTGNFDKAIDCAEQALKIRLQIIGMNHKAIPETLIAIAQLYEAKGDMRGATEWYDRSLVLQSDNATVAKWLFHVAKLHTGLGQHERAEKNYTRALEIYERESGQNSYQVCAVLAQLGNTYVKQKKNQQAERAYLRALAIMRRLEGPTHPDNASLIVLLINYYEEQGDFSEAVNYLEQLLPIYERKEGIDSVQTANLYNHLGRAHYALHDYASAELLFERAYKILEKKLEPNHADVIQLRDNVQKARQAQTSGLPQGTPARPTTSGSQNNIPYLAKSNNSMAIALISELGHSQSVTSVAFSADWKLAVTGSEDRTARLWRTEYATELHTFVGHEGPVVSVDMSPDGRYVLTGSSDNTAMLWNAATGEVLEKYAIDNCGDFRLKVVGLSPTSEYMLTVCQNNYALLWKTKSGEKLRNTTFPAGRPAAFAFSPSGRMVLWAGDDDDAILSDLATGKEIKRFHHPTYVSSVSFSKDGNIIATGSGDHIIRIWDVATGKETRRLRGHTDKITAINISPNGRLLVSGGGPFDHTARLWDLNTGAEVHRFTDDSFYEIRFVQFAPNGLYVNISGTGQTARIWDAQSGKEVMRLEGVKRKSLDSVAFSADGQSILTRSDYNTVQLWGSKRSQSVLHFVDEAEKARAALFPPRGKVVIEGRITEGKADLHVVGTGEKVLQLKTGPGGSHTMALSPNGQHVFIGDFNGNIRIHDVITGKEVRRISKHDGWIEAITLSINGSNIATASADKTAILWDTSTGKQVQRFIGHEHFVTCVDISRDKQQLITGSLDGTVRLWNVDTGKEFRRFSGLKAGVESCIFSPDGLTAATGSEETIYLWSTQDGKIHYTLPKAGSRSIAFSSDGKWIATVGKNGEAALWDAKTGRPLLKLKGHSGDVLSVAFLADGRFVMTGGEDGTVRLWNTTNGLEYARLIVFGDFSSAVIDSYGRFDSDRLEEIRGLHWACLDDPFTPMPPEIFMRDYYEPRLLPRVLAGERFKPVRPLAELNRAQPGVKILKVGKGSTPDIAKVTVEVSAAERIFQRNGKDVVMKSGVHDLRLYRNGQLVGQWPRAGEVTYKSLNTTSGEELKAWRKATEIKLDESGKATKTFDVRLPRRQDLKEVAFTAYAFNLDRVKSETARQTYKVPPGLDSVKGRAYVITVGVSGNEDPAWGDLTVPASDAKLIQGALAKKLGESGKYEKIVSVPLITVPAALGLDDEATRKERQTFINPTKQNIRTVIDILARGKEKAGAARLEQLPAKLLAELRRVEPEDLVVLSVSSHGVTDKDGEFYLLPYDLGAGSGGKATPKLLKRSISSQELSLWLSGVDAEQMVMVVDACHSAAAVEAEGFKPGPMGNPGLGQLSYDKGMPILVASQATDSAWAEGGYSLLSYALAREGVEEKKMGLNEALRYAEQRVPKLYEERMGKEEKKKIQEPKLFEFVKHIK